MSSHAVSSTVSGPRSESAARRNPSAIALIVGLLGLGIAGVGLLLGLFSEEPNSRLVLSWLLGFSFWFSIGIGILMLVMMWYVFGAGWPTVIRRQLEHALAAFPWLALIFLPLLLVSLFGGDLKGILWQWLDPSLVYPGGSKVGEDPLFLHKIGYLNPTFFTIRVLIYALVFLGLSSILRSCSFRMDTDPNLAHYHRGRKWSAFGVIAVALCLTFAAFDFFMSMSYHWFSTMYGVWFFAGSMRAGLAVTVIICVLLAMRGGRLEGLYNKAHAYDLGSLAFAFTVFWAYVTFSQYFLIYNANIPEETFWYNMRELAADGSYNSWWYVGVIGLVFGYFVIPFCYLLFNRNKVDGNKLLYISVWILLFHIVDLYYNIMPKKVAADNPLGYEVVGFSVNVWDIAAIVGVGGICVWAWLRSAAHGETIPIHDPKIEESIHHSV